jgi:hypothetical protein
MAGSTETEQFGAAKSAEGAIPRGTDRNVDTVPVRLTARAEELYDDGLVHGHAWARADA